MDILFTSGIIMLIIGILLIPLGLVFVLLSAVFGWKNNMQIGLKMLLFAGVLLLLSFGTCSLYGVFGGRLF